MYMTYWPSMATHKSKLTSAQQQTDQLDIFHGICLLARKNRLHRAPLRDMHGLRILDLGTGTGIWPLDMSQ